MKRLLLILVFVSFIGCATTSQPVSYNNTEMRSDEPQSEEAKKLGKELAEDSLWLGISIFMSHAFNVWPF